MLKKSQSRNLAEEEINRKTELLISSPCKETHFKHTHFDARNVCVHHSDFLDVNCPEITYTLSQYYEYLTAQNMGNIKYYAYISTKEFYLSY